MLQILIYMYFNISQQVDRPIPKRSAIDSGESPVAAYLRNTANRTSGTMASSKENRLYKYSSPLLL